MNLKPQDILFLLKLVAQGKQPWSFNKLSIEIGMSPSEVHAAAKRSIAARLAIKSDEGIFPNIRNLEEFLMHGIQYVFIPERGGLSRGMPTAYAASPMDSLIVADQEPPPVWPDAEGTIRGESLSPLYSSVPKAARNDDRLYELLALVDAIRGGRARERDIAKKELQKRLLVSEDTPVKPSGNEADELVIGDNLVISQSELERLVKAHHINRLVLFGSAARGELKPNSDIDLLIEFETGKAPTLGGMVKINDDFSALFGGRQVDIATPSILNNPYRRKEIEKDMEELYAA